MDFPAIFAKIEPKANLRFDLLPLIYQLGSDCGPGTFVQLFRGRLSDAEFGQAKRAWRVRQGAGQHEAAPNCAHVTALVVRRQ
jgi:hypothetical protein